MRRRLTAIAAIALVGAGAFAAPAALADPVRTASGADDLISVEPRLPRLPAVEFPRDSAPSRPPGMPDPGSVCATMGGILGFPPPPPPPVTPDPVEAAYYQVTQTKVCTGTVTRRFS